MEHGEAENFTPKVIAVSIGQSESGENTASAADDFLGALGELADTLHAKQPNAELVFMVSGQVRGAPLPFSNCSRVGGEPTSGDASWPT